jgi:hypothetical protein
MSSILEKGANGFLIVASIVVLGQYGYRMINRPDVQWKHAVDPGYRVRDSKELRFSSAPRTILVMTSHTCEYCVAIMPFYKSAVNAARGHGTRVIALTWENPDENRRFLASNGIAVDAVVSGRASGVQVKGVPSLMLVRRDGSVIDSWSGQPRDKSYAHVVLAAINEH